VAADERRIAVFFYGLFMDVEALRRRSIRPAAVERGCVRGFSLQIGRRATLVPDDEGCVHGVLMTLSQDEIERLYADPGVRMYRPEAVLCELDRGACMPALCFNLSTPPQADERNQEYAHQLQELARRLGLPASYIDRIC
jgi:hypothetical protein